MIAKGEILERWLCGDCNETHKYEMDAEDCCKPTVERVWECSACEEVFKKKSETLTHPCADPVAAGEANIEGNLCLCGARLIPEDYRPSILLGSQISCERCREKVLAGTPAPEAIRQSFTERGIAVR